MAIMKIGPPIRARGPSFPLFLPERSAEPRPSSAKSKNPEDFSSIHTASGSSHYIACSSARSIINGFLKLSLCATVKRFLKHTLTIPWVTSLETSVQRSRSLTAQAHQGSRSGFGMACRGGRVRVTMVCREGRALAYPHRFADKLMGANTTSTQRHAVPRAEPGISA
jgi:hypothetical protein